MVSKVTDEVFEDRNMYEALMTGQAKVPRKTDKVANPAKNTKLFDMFTTLERRLRILEDMPDKVPSTVIHKHYKDKQLKVKTAKGIAGKLNVNLIGDKDKKSPINLNLNTTPQDLNQTNPTNQYQPPNETNPTSNMTHDIQQIKQFENQALNDEDDDEFKSYVIAKFKILDKMVNLKSMNSGDKKVEFDGDQYADKYDFDKFKRDTKQNIEDIGIKIDILKSNTSNSSKNKNLTELPHTKDVEFKNYLKREEFKQIMEKVEYKLGKIDQIDFMLAS